MQRNGVEEPFPQSRGQNIALSVFLTAPAQSPEIKPFPAHVWFEMGHAFSPNCLLPGAMLCSMERLKVQPPVHWAHRVYTCEYWWATHFCWNAAQMNDMTGNGRRLMGLPDHKNVTLMKELVPKVPNLDYFALDSSSVTPFAAKHDHCWSSIGHIQNAEKVVVAWNIRLQGL